MSLTAAVLLFGTLFAAVQSATVLDGYLISGGKCYNNDGADTLTMPTPTTVASDCTKVTVAGDATAGYTIVEADTTTKQFTFAAETDGTALTLTTTGTNFKFVDTSDAALCGEELDASGSPFLIDIKTGTQTGSDCFKNDLTYANTEDATTCNAMLFYFETVDCSSIPDCSLCYDDGGTLKCSSCGNNKKPDTDKTACEACTVNNIVDECGIECTACEAAKVPNADHNACEACPEGQVPDGTGETCAACTSPEVANEAGSDCVACDVAMDDCDTCTSYEACTACKNNKVLNQTGTACEDVEGYLVFEGETKCFKADGSSPSSVTPTTISDDCTKVKITGDDSDGYILVVAEDTTKQFTYAADTDATPLTLTTSGTAFQFVVDGSAVTAVSDLVNPSAPVLVVLNDGPTDGQDCILEDLTYENTDDATSCNSKGWYFVLDCSAVEDCDTCTVDDMTKISCSTCVSPKILSDGQCQSCSGSQVPNADGNACQDCSDSEVPNADGSACEACPDGEVPNADGTACEESTDSGSNVILPMSLGAVLLMAAMGKIVLA